MGYRQHKDYRQHKCFKLFIDRIRVKCMDCISVKESIWIKDSTGIRVIDSSRVIPCISVLVIESI